MGTRVRWIVVGVGVVLVLGIVGLLVFNSSLFGRTEPKTWIVQRGETLHVPADEVLPDDRWECPGKAITLLVLLALTLYRSISASLPGCRFARPH